MKETIVLYPHPSISHLVAMVELGKRFLQLKSPFSITILIPQSSSPNTTFSTTSYIQTIQSSFPSITFHHLPPISLPPSDTFKFIHLTNPLVHQALLSISSPRALIFDFFCYSVLDITTHLHIPAYCFFPSPASSLVVLLHLPTFQSLTNTSIKDLKHTHLSFPGLPPIPPLDIPRPLLDRNKEEYYEFITLAKALPKSNGIIINTFESLEPRAVQTMRDGACIPDGSTPSIFCIGPLIADEKGDGGVECLEWLDSQPNRSVVFLCFGSMGSFSADQLKEIAIGLEKSGQAFLWVVRNSPSEDDIDDLLPEGFLERTKERGMVVRSWAPQVAVLNHDSVGGFVTHCGWNSVLESLCAGVPMVGWPLYAEQRLNRVVLVEGLKLALSMEDKGENRWVEAEEVERRVRGLMESEEGNELRERTVAMKEKARAAVMEGGSSYSALTELAELWMRG